MTKNPILNALSAVLYITLIGSLLHFGSTVMANTPDTILTPIAMLSLFSLSAAVMAYAFFYRPVLMYLEGEKVAAVKLGLHTVAAFAGITIVLFAFLVLPKFF